MSMYGVLYQINTRICLYELSRAIGRRATLDDVPGSVLDEIAARGFDWLWLLGVWQTGAAARDVSRSRADWRDEFLRTLPDLTDDDITGSPYAVQAYTPHADFGGDAALARFRERLGRRNVRLMLDFVPNHTAPDHRWVSEHPEYYVLGNDADVAREPHNYCRIFTSAGPRVFAYGRDPYFPGWADTVQLNFRSSGLRSAMRRTLGEIAARCDGVRCDMAMLLLPDVIARTWGEKSRPADGTPPVDECFWPEAIRGVRESHAEFTFMAEVYWDLEWTLQQQGFDYTYDKRLYDRLHAKDAGAVRGHLHADLDFQKRSARFLENHDEPRAAAAFPGAVQRAAAVVAFLTPGLRFFHEGQFEGRKVRVSMHLGRRPIEQPDPELGAFYDRLLGVLRRPEARDGQWRLVDCRPAWPGNPTWERFIIMHWEQPTGRRLLVCVNYGPTQGQCVARLADDRLRGRAWRLRDLLGPAVYERQGTEMANEGLFLDMPAWGYHVFELSAA
jgi:glycosidase